jgi:ribosomal protein S30
VRGQTPKVPKQDKKKKPTGRACKRLKYNRRFVNVGAWSEGGAVTRRRRADAAASLRPSALLRLAAHAYAAAIDALLER